MTSHVQALASQLASLELVRDLTHEPSASAILLVACAALVLGRLIGSGSRKTKD